MPPTELRSDLSCNVFCRTPAAKRCFGIKVNIRAQNVYLVAGDFWLNIYADSLNVGADLLTGTRLTRYVSLRRIVEVACKVANADFDFILVDLPPSFGALVRAAFYSSDYYIVPCTSDNFCVYCVGLIGQMVPSFVADWQIGLQRFKTANPHYSEFNDRGKPVFAGWVFNGFDTARERRTSAEIAANVPLKDKRINQADQTMHDRIARAIEEDLVNPLKAKVNGFAPVASTLSAPYRVGDIEDANVLIQNSLWLSVPLGQLASHHQVLSRQDRGNWASNQVTQINLLATKFTDLATNVIATCT